MPARGARGTVDGMIETPRAVARSPADSPTEVVHRLIDNVEQVVRGKSAVVRHVVTALLARGHVLLEDIPGVGKTTIAASVARSLGGTFRRIQFTNDLLPSDIIGVSVFDQAAGKFEFRRGPIFANVILADEINRTTPRTQSCLLEAMNSGTVSVDGETTVLDAPFLVMATQNPLEFYGTYPLPESQLDRFLMRLAVGYPDAPYEREIILRPPGEEAAEALEPMLTPDDVVALQEACDRVRVDESIIDYLHEIVVETRHSTFLSLGCSPRGAQALLRACRARAVVEGRPYCVPDDVKDLTLPVLSHRVRLSGRSEGLEGARDESERVLRDILEKVPVPT